MNLRLLSNQRRTDNLLHTSLAWCAHMFGKLVSKLTDKIKRTMHLIYQSQNQEHVEQLRYLKKGKCRRSKVNIILVGSWVKNHTFGAVIIRHRPVAIQSNPNLAILRGFKTFTVKFHSMCVCKDYTMPDTRRVFLSNNLSLWIQNILAYIHGSVAESPSAERSRSLDLPGAKTPRP